MFAPVNHSESEIFSVKTLITYCITSQVPVYWPPKPDALWDIRKLSIATVHTFLSWLWCQWVHIQIPPTGNIGLIWRSTAEATASWGIVEATLQLLWQEYHACWSYSIPTKYPQRYSNCSSLSCPVSYETYGQKEARCVLLDALSSLCLNLIPQGV